MKEKKVCENYSENKCQGEERRCYYLDKCLGVVPSKSDIANQVITEGVMACEDDYNCASGYCKEFSGALASMVTGVNTSNIKLCAKPAECRPLCTKMGDLINNPSEGFCCEGSIAYDNGVETKCVDPAELISVEPPLFKVEINPSTCEGEFMRMASLTRTERIFQRPVVLIQMIIMKLGQKKRKPLLPKRKQEGFIGYSEQ